MTGEPVSAERMAELVAEYDRTREEARAAEARHRAASDAMMAAQCGVHYEITKPEGGRWVHHFCTLPRGHDGDHGKYREPEVTTGAVPAR